MTEHETGSSGSEQSMPRKANGTPVAYRPTVRLRRRKARLHWWILLTALALVLPIYFVGRSLLGVHTVWPEAEALTLEEVGAGGERFPHQEFGEVLSTHVRDGRVDYEALVEDSEPLRRYAATLAEVGPEEAPERFPSREDRLAYYLNAHNALVLLSVVEHWPIETVLEIRGRIEPVAGSGFFWSQRFRLDGGGINLYSLENDLLREELSDARVHAAINYAARGCPRLSSSAYEPDRVDAQLDEAARRLAGNPAYVWVDHETQEVRLSSVFDWYADDFVAHVQQLEAGETVLDWIRYYASPAVADDLRTAAEQGYSIRFWDFDWHLNGW